MAYDCEPYHYYNFSFRIFIVHNNLLCELLILSGIQNVHALHSRTYNISNKEQRPQLNNIYRTAENVINFMCAPLAHWILLYFGYNVVMYSYICTKSKFSISKIFYLFSHRNPNAFAATESRKFSISVLVFLVFPFVVCWTRYASVTRWNSPFYALAFTFSVLLSLAPELFPFVQFTRKIIKMKRAIVPTERTTQNGRTPTKISHFFPNPLLAK